VCRSTKHGDDGPDHFQRRAVRGATWDGVTRGAEKIHRDHDQSGDQGADRNVDGEQEVVETIEDGLRLRKRVLEIKLPRDGSAGNDIGAREEGGLDGVMKGHRRECDANGRHADDDEGHDKLVGMSHACSARAC